MELNSEWASCKREREILERSYVKALWATTVRQREVGSLNDGA